MNRIASNLLRLSLLLALLLTPGVAPMASAQGPQQPSSTPCPYISFLGKIIGTVRNSEGQPLQGVEVRAHATKGAGLKVGHTNAAGEYGIPVPPDTYLLEFRPSDGPLQVAWYKDAASPLDATLVEVGDGKTVSGLDVKLPAGAQFNVTLHGPDGEPVPEGLISVFDRYGRKVAEGQTDDQGRALTAPGLPADSYRLFSRPPYGSALLASYHNQKPTLEEADPLPVTEAGSVDVPITLQRGARLSGTVTNAATGTPLDGMAVEVRGTGGTAQYVTTDTQGRYSVEGLYGGMYQVEFRSDGQPQPSSPAPLRRLVSLSAPNAQTGFDAALTDGGAISGRVTGPDGTPLPDVSVHVRGNDGAIDTYGSTAADGTYAIYGLPSGRYTLAYAAYNRQALTLAEQVTVTAPDTTRLVDSVLSPGSAVSGKVTDPEGKPVEGVYVSFLDAATGKAHIGSYTSAEGVYTTPPTLASGSYIVKFQPPGSEGQCPLAIEYSGNAASAAAATRVQVSAPGTVTGIDATLEYGGHITGQISDAASGLPLSGEVQVYDAGGALVTNGSVWSLGRYRTTAALPSGAYRVRFVADGYVSMFYGGATVLEAAARVPSGAGEINLALSRGGTLMGRITAADTGAPLEYAAVTLYGAGERVVGTLLTAFDGGYHFRGSLPSGAYRLGVAAGRRDDGTPYFTGYEAVFSGGARSLAQAQPIALISPQLVTVNLAMPTTQSPPPQPLPQPSPQPSPGGERLYLPLITR